MCSRGKAGLLELLLWDVILVVLVAGLAFINGSLEAKVTEAPPGQPEVSPPPTTPGGDPRPDPVAPSTPGDPRPDVPPAEDARARAELAALAKRADEKVRAGEVEQALAIYSQAPGWLKTSPAWAEAWPKAEAHLLGLQRDADLLTALRPEVQLAADQGNAKLVSSLLARVPATQRKELESETSWARTHLPASDGMQIRGFSPDRIELKGRLCSLECELKRVDASQMLAELDTLLARSARILGKQPPGRLSVQVLGPAEPALKPDASHVILYQRDGETAAEVLPRLRLATVDWLLRRTVKRRKALHTATGHALCGATGGALNAEGAARRRLFLAQRPDGSGARLLEATQGLGATAAATGNPTGMGLMTGAQSAATPDPAGVRLWALVHYALAGTDPAVVDLKHRLKKALLEDERALTGWLTPIKAAGLEPGWLAFMERG